MTGKAIPSESEDALTNRPQLENGVTNWEMLERLVIAADDEITEKIRMPDDLAGLV